MNKRVSARAIIIEDDCVYLMFRRRIKDDGTVKEYYVIPGGGQEEGEELTDTVLREIKEEFQVDVKVLGFLGSDEGEDSIANFFACSIENGVPTLGGEELDKQSESYYYEIRKISMSELENIDVLSKDLIYKAYNKEY
ncbi:MAG: NUDIX domain-containing protein [Clostridia bacterium]|nr:NUDIX domain-containing protein [Clostridia bacterium]